MAKIKNIEFYNFRNFKNFNISFDNKLNILFGDNGCGKTNILEGISLIAKGKGIRNSNIINLIKKQEDNFLIKNNLEIQKNDFNIEIFTEQKSEKFKKIIKINDDSSKDSLNFLNQSISYLVFVPEMERLFQASPSYRRNFLDRLIFSSRNDYNRLINKYKKSLLERNKILQSYNIDDDWLNRIESEICSLGLEIYKLRNSQLNILNIELSNMKNDHNFQFDVKLKIKDDARRIYQAHKETVNPAHPFAKFSVGNLQTLADRKRCISDELRDFFNQHYQAQWMTLVICANESLDTLEAWATQYFSQIKGDKHQLKPPIILLSHYLSLDAMKRCIL